MGKGGLIRKGNEERQEETHSFICSTNISSTPSCIPSVHWLLSGKQKLCCSALKTCRQVPLLLWNAQERLGAIHMEEVMKI